MSSGGDGGAAARAAQDRADQDAREARIKKNISLIDVIFENDPEGIRADQLALTQELGTGLADKARREEIAKEQAFFSEASSLLGTGPSKAEREGEVVQNVEDFFFSDLEDQRDKATRDVRFELARRGGFGGSQEIDALEEFQKKEDRARLDIGNVALDARNDLRSQDAQLKSSLIDQANRDIQTDVLTNQFTNNLGQGLAQASDRARLTQFDPFFENAGNLFSNVSLARGDQLGRERAQKQLSFFSADPGRNFGSVRG